MKDDYVEAARARGISERDVVYHHAFKNALVPGDHRRSACSSPSCSAAPCSPRRPSTGRGSATSSSSTSRTATTSAVQGIIIVFGARGRLRQPGDRLRQRVHRPEDPVLMATRTSRLGRGLGCGPIAARRAASRGRCSASASGSPSFFVLLAILAPLISPYGFDQYQSGRPPASRSSRRRRSEHLMGTTVAVDGRALAGDLGRADRDRGRGHLARLRAHGRRPARPPLRLLRRASSTAGSSWSWTRCSRSRTSCSRS